MLLRSRYLDLENPAPRALWPVLGLRDRHGVAGPRRLRMPFPANPIIERFWAKVSKGSSCWLWTGCVNPKGYGNLHTRGNYMVLSHRFAWMIFRGDPGDKCVLHRCDVPACVNPDHLFLGTKAENNKDMIAKGRHPLIGDGTSCQRGHPRIPENIYEYVTRNGSLSRSCLVCRRLPRERKG